jgi:hypothetical protein
MIIKKMIIKNFESLLNFKYKRRKNTVETDNEDSLFDRIQSDKTKFESTQFTYTILSFLILSVAFLFSPVFCKAQDSIIIKGQFVGNTKFAKVIMKKFDVGNFPVGGAAIKGDSFKLVLPPDIPSGVYRFQYAIGEGERYIDVIINGKEKQIAFVMKANDEMALPNFLASKENKQWYA